jgi:hypothetical protein
MIDYALKYKILRQALGISQAEFAIKTGTSRSIISQIEIGKLKPSLANTSREFNVPLPYFFRSGETPNDENYLHLNIVSADIVREPVTKSLMVSNISNMLFVPVKERSKYIAGIGNPDYYRQLEYYNIPGCLNGNYRIFEVEGHSMQPTFNSGDYVVGEKVSGITGVKRNNIYIIVSFSEGIIIKRALNAILKGGEKLFKLQLAGDNTDKVTYPLIDLTPSDIAEIWQFHMLITKLPSGPDQTLGRLSSLEGKVESIRQQIHKK